MKNVNEKNGYPFTARRLSDEEGGGWLVEFPDLPGCMADGETIEEAVRESSGALESWLECSRKFDDTIPKPYSKYSGRWVQRVPRSLHARISSKAKQEGVSINAYVTSILAHNV